MPDATDDVNPKASPRRSAAALRWFWVTVSLLTAAVYVPIIQEGSFRALGGLAVPIIMWTPGVSALVASLVVFRSFRPLGLGLSLRTLAWIGVCIGLTVVYTLAVHGLLAGLQLISLGPAHLTFEFLVLGFGMSLLFSTGEELGWRGFAVPLMVERFGFWKGNGLIGLVWGLYHLPAMLFGGYGDGAGLFAIACFFVTVMALSCFLGHVRLRSCSVWPAAAYHAAHNLLFLHLFDPVKPLSKTADLLRGETGILLAVIMMGVAGWVALVRSKGASSERVA